MSRFTQSVVLSLSIVLSLMTAAPARGAIPVLPLEPTQVLPVPPESAGHTPPALVLRPGGGMVAVWHAFGDSSAVEGLVARAFGPPDASGASESELFLLSPLPTGAVHDVAVARGDGDTYLAAWRERGGQERFLVRAFAGDGDLLSDATVAVTGEVFSFALAPRPGGTFLLAWWEGPIGEAQLFYRSLGATGTPLGSVHVADLPPDAGQPLTRVAVGADGAFAISWSWYDTDAEATVLRARTFSRSGVPIGGPFELFPEQPANRSLDHDLAAVGVREFLVAWAEDFDLELGTLQVRSFDADGDLGPARRMDVTDAPIGATGFPRIAGAADGEAVVAWSEEVPETVRVVGRLVDADGRARSEPFTVHGEVYNEDLYVNGVAVDRDVGGRLAFGWGLGIDVPILPPGDLIFNTSRARRFQETDPSCAPVLALDFRTEPPAPVTGEPVRLRFDAVTDCADLSLVDWGLVAGTFRVEAEAEGQACGTVPPLEVSLPVEVGALDAGEYAVEIDVALPEGGTCSRDFQFAVAEDGEPPPPPPHPDAPPLTSVSVPGFRVWVAITAAPGDTILGTKVEPCIPETLCVAGRLPDRHEVFVRVVGPKPNGRLWPTLVKFTTSTVEVWIEQFSTGEVEYYRLEGARPGFDELPGLFDREGFEP